MFFGDCGGVGGVCEGLSGNTVPSSNRKIVTTLRLSSGQAPGTGEYKVSLGFPVWKKDSARNRPRRSPYIRLGLYSLNHDCGNGFAGAAAAVLGIQHVSSATGADRAQFDGGS